MNNCAHSGGEDTGSLNVYYFVTCVSGCGLRYPAAQISDIRQTCPRCGGPVHITRYTPSQRAYETSVPTVHNRASISVLADNVRSVFNVGSIFRCADGARVAHLYLCGISPTPDHPKIAKTALGAERSVPWSYHPNSVCIASTLVDLGYAVWALDTMEGSKSLFDLKALSGQSRIVLAVGNELCGLDPLLVEQCSRTIRIPMAGHKRSLNVAIALGISVYWLLGRQLIEQ